MGRAIRLGLALSAALAAATAGVRAQQPAMLAAGPAAQEPSPLATPDGMPQILEIRLSPTVVHRGTLVHAEVHTTTQVVSVVAIAAGRTIRVAQIGPGEFACDARVPFYIPPFSGAYAVTFRAHDARGRMTQAAANVVVR